jgi:hypothetical protein
MDSIAISTDLGNLMGDVLSDLSNLIGDLSEFINNLNELLFSFSSLIIDLYDLIGDLNNLIIDLGDHSNLISNPSGRTSHPRDLPSSLSDLIELPSKSSKASAPTAGNHKIVRAYGTASPRMAGHDPGPDRDSRHLTNPTNVTDLIDPTELLKPS